VACQADPPAGLALPDVALDATVDATAPVNGVYGIGDSRSRRRCTAAPYRQFDFWVGNWSITNPQGAPAGVSQITKELDGCAIMENYTGTSGRSITRYERATRTWHQDYIDNIGFALRLAGRAGDGGVIRLADSLRAIPNGPTLASKFTWTPNADGTVRQLWDFSLDGGNSFFVNFDGLYAPDPNYQEPAPPTPGTCVARPVYRSLDALIGTWAVTDPDGESRGTATLALTAGQCALEERFVGRRGYESRALIYFDRFVARWYRTQMDNATNTFRVGGSLAGSVLSLSGVVAGEDGTTSPLRVIWDLSNPARLTQQWDVQRNGVWGRFATLVWTKTS
jgi:hypothetical protein